MKTFILFWNPRISSYKFEDLQRELEEMSECYNNMNWSVWEYDKAHAGDRFFMVRCGDGKTGICMSGYFSSEPYKDEDWSGRGRVTYYLDLEPDVMIHPEYLPILTTNELMSEIPTFDWTGGHSGRLLDDVFAVKLETLWKSFVEKNEEKFKIRAFRQEVDPSDFVRPADNTIVCYLSLTSKGKVQVYNFHNEIDEAFDNVEKAKQYAHDKLKDQETKGSKVLFKFEHVEDENQEIFSTIFEKLISLHLPQNYYELIEDQYDDELLTVCLYCLVLFGDESLTSLLKQDIPYKIKDALKALIPIEGEPEEKYIKRVADNDIALGLKKDILDMELNIHHLDKISTEDVSRLNKALKAMHLLFKYGDINVD